MRIRSILFSALLLTSLPVFAVSWQTPTPEELHMTSQPEVPGADAVYLNLEESDDDRDIRANSHTVYVRLKVLTEEGRKYGNVTILSPDRLFLIKDVQGRTIHSDGSVLPFTGKPYRKNNEDIFALPDVQVGSIIEYRYVLSYDGYIVVPPQWFLQQSLFVRNAKYYFAPSAHTIANGRGDMSEGTAYSSNLPKGASVKYIPSQNAYELIAHDIPPIPDEESMPPLQSFSYRVLFYYTGAQTEGDYWVSEGRYWSKDMEKFMSVSRLRDVVAPLISPTDSDQQKVSKIYDAVMQLENTSFTREHTAAENKAAGIRIKTASDIWNHKRGNSDEIALLFVGMVRAAGLNAWPMAVTNRDRAVFIPSYLDITQLDDIIAIVQLDGKEQYFDPGERYCAFGQLHWKHTVTQGLRQTNGGTAIAKTPSAPYSQAQTARVASLELSPNGKLQGFIRITMSGVPALEWRQRALQSDEADVKKQMEQEVQATLPPGVEVKTHHFIGLDDYKSVLMVQLDVSGTMGVATAKRLLLPSSFFEASSKPRFVHGSRTTPVYLRYAQTTQDTVTIDLPKNFTVESVPKDANIPLPGNAVFKAQYAFKDNTYTLKRTYVMANFYFDSGDYGSLKDFYQKMSAQDQEQAVLTPHVGGNGQ